MHTRAPLMATRLMVRFKRSTLWDFKECVDRLLRCHFMHVDSWKLCFLSNLSTPFLFLLQSRRCSVKAACHRGLWCLSADQSLWTASGRNSTGCRRSLAGSLSSAWLVRANPSWLLKLSDTKGSSKVTNTWQADTIGMGYFKKIIRKSVVILDFQQLLTSYLFDLLSPSAECFPGGIHWLSIGQLDKPDLLVKIQSLCFRLEQSLDSQSLHRPPNSLDEAKERMRFLMLRRYPRWLYVQTNSTWLVFFRWMLLLFKLYTVQFRWTFELNLGRKKNLPYFLFTCVNMQCKYILQGD